MSVRQAACLLCFAACVSATAPPRIAVCFIGHARSFEDPRARANLVQNLLEPLRRGAGVVDVIVRMKVSEASDWGKKAIREGIEELGAVDVFVSEDRVCEACRENASITHCGPVNQTERKNIRPLWFRVYGHASMTSCIGQASSFRACADAVRENEARAGERYDVVLQTRADFFYPEPVPGACAWPRDAVIHLGCDQFLAGSRDLVVPMLDAYWEDWASCRPGRCGDSRIEDVVLRSYRTVGNPAVWPESWSSEGVGLPSILRNVDEAIVAMRSNRSSEPPCYEDAPPLKFTHRVC